MSDLDLEFNSLTEGILDDEDDRPSEPEYLAPIEEEDDEEYLEEEEEDDRLDERFEPYICIFAASVEYLQRGDIRRMMDECLAKDRTDLAHYVLEYHPGFEHDLRHWLDYDRLLVENDRSEEDDRPDEEEKEYDRPEEPSIDPSLVTAIEMILKFAAPNVAAMSIRPLLEDKGYSNVEMMLALITGGADISSVLLGYNPLEEELKDAIDSFSPGLSSLMREKWDAIVSILFSSTPKPSKPTAPKAKRKAPAKVQQRSSGEGSAKAQLLQLMRQERKSLAGSQWASIATRLFGRVESTYTVQLSALKREGLVVQEGETPDGTARYRAK
jgi:hypothetical protein